MTSYHEVTWWIVWVRMACASTTKTTTTTTGSWKKTPKPEKQTFPQTRSPGINWLKHPFNSGTTHWEKIGAKPHDILEALKNKYDIHISSLKHIYTTRNKSSQRFEATTKARLGKPLGLPWSVAIKLDGSSARWSCVRATSCSGQRLDGLGCPVDGQWKM